VLFHFHLIKGHGCFVPKPLKKIDSLKREARSCRLARLEGTGQQQHHTFITSKIDRAISFYRDQGDIRLQQHTINERNELVAE
jgi:hypothetical protein